MNSSWCSIMGAGHDRPVALSVVDGDPAKLSLPSDVQTILLAEKRTNEQSKRLAGYYASQHPRLRELDQRLAKLKSERDAIRPDSTLVMNEMGGARETRVMLRGDYLNAARRYPPVRRRYCILSIVCRATGWAWPSGWSHRKIRYYLAWR